MNLSISSDNIKDNFLWSRMVKSTVSVSYNLFCSLSIIESLIKVCSTPSYSSAKLAQISPL